MIRRISLLALSQLIVSTKKGILPRPTSISVQLGSGNLATRSERIARPDSHVGSRRLIQSPRNARLVRVKGQAEGGATTGVSGLQLAIVALTGALGRKGSFRKCFAEVGTKILTQESVIKFSAHACMRLVAKAVAVFFRENTFPLVVFDVEKGVCLYICFACLLWQKKSFLAQDVFAEFRIVKLRGGIRIFFFISLLFYLLVCLQ